MWIVQVMLHITLSSGLATDYNVTWSCINVADTHHLNLRDGFTEKLESWAKNKTHTTVFSLAFMCGKWLFAYLTWPVLRPGFRRWWPLFAVRYPLCLVEVDRETAVSWPSLGHRHRLVLVHRVRWDPSSSWSGHPYFQRKLAVFFSRRIHTNS